MVTTVVFFYNFQGEKRGIGRNLIFIKLYVKI